MTMNPDDFDKILRDTPSLTPPEDKKKQSIFNAMQAFEQKNSVSTQGIKEEARLMNAVRTFFEPFFGGHFMKPTYIIAGGLCMGAVAFALLSTSHLTDVVPIPEPTPEVTVKAKEEPGAAKPAELKPETAASNQAPEVQTSEAVSADLSDPLQSSKDISEGIPSQKPESFAAAPPPPPPANMPMKALDKSDTALGMGAGVAGSAASSRSSLMMEKRADVSTHYYQDQGRDKFESVTSNSVKVAKEEPVSTFSIDVDTASYAFVRSSLNNNTLPQKDAVRVEEMINYFPYEYAAPGSKTEPFKANVSVFPNPWNTSTKLMHIGIKGYQIEQKEKPRANLVFLIDTSGSMNAPNKLPLVQNAMKMLLDSLNPEDTVAIVTYAGSAGTALPPTKAQDKAKIMAALDNLHSGGSTAGAEGIRQAYQLAEQHKVSGVNRVILATDGDFNVGITDPNELKSFVERKRETGITLSVLGFGQGNYNDQLMQTLAQNGNGNAAYIDNLNEARKVLVNEASATLFTIAKDVKIQVEFNPAKVSEYRLVGYETRILNREDFNNDKVDAGDIGAGHTVTAIYEITPAGSDAKLVDELRYKQAEKPAEAKGDEYAFVKMRYKLPESDKSTLISTAVTAKNEFADTKGAPQEAQFATSVAAFGQLLRGDAYVKNFTYDDVIHLAESNKGKDMFGYRSEFINLVRVAKNASSMQPLQQ